EDGADLKPLAALSRKLLGRTQRMNRGADVFLVSPSGRYLGRVCLWRRCGPGIRASCDAWHCGQRLYLHDDFGDVRLDDGLVVAPPVELWSDVVVRIPVPEDVEHGLLDILRAAGTTSNK